MLSAQNAVQAICQYMFDELNFDYFDYHHYYDDGRSLILINDQGDGLRKSFLQRYFAEGIYLQPDDLDALRKLYHSQKKLFGFRTAEYSLLDQLPTTLKHRKALELTQSFQIGNRIYFVERHSDHVELAGFGSNFHNSNFCNFCVQNMVILQSFIKYFRDEGHNLIEAAKKNPVLIAPLSTYQSPNQRFDRMQYVGYDFKNNKKINLSLTGQEAASLKQLGTGKTFKEAAKNLLISPPTVENHIYSAKMKSKCKSTDELLELFSTLTRR